MAVKLAGKVNFNNTQNAQPYNSNRQGKNSLSKHEVIHVEDPSDFQYPGISSIIYAPLSIVDTVRHVSKINAKRDLEGTIDATIRFQLANLSLIYSISSIIHYAFHFFHHALRAFIFLRRIEGIVPYVGLILGILGSIPEIWGIHRIRQFKKIFADKHNAAQYSHAKDVFIALNVEEKLKRLQNKYFSLSANETNKITNYAQKKYKNLSYNDLNVKIHEIQAKALFVKKCNLARRVRPWMAAEAHDKIPRLLKGFNSTDPTERTQCLTGAKALISEMEIQARKKMLVHIVGLFALAICVIGSIIALVMLPGAPILVTGVLFVAGVAFSMARYLTAAGYLDTRGWDFSWINCMPQWVKSRYVK